MTRSQGWLLLALGWTLAAGCLLYRAGVYPAAMTGDEIWFSEAAWHLLQEGRLIRPLHAGALLSEAADFLPPLTALIQAASFAVFGVNAFAVGFQSAAAPLAIGLLVSLSARRLGAEWRWAALAGVAALGAPSILRASLYIRYEALVLICFLGAYCARSPPLRGALIALAGIAYYPTAPFVGLAALLIEAHRPGPRPWIKLAAGFALPTAVFALWVARYPEPFIAQVLRNGAGNYLTFEAPKRFFEVAFWRESLDAFPEILCLLTLAGLELIRRAPPTPKGWLLALALLAIPALIYPFSARLLATPIALGLVLAAVWATRRPRLIGGALGVGAGVAAIALPLMAATAWYQAEGRDSRAVSEALDRLMTQPGLAVIDQRAWLAIRMSQPLRPLLQAMPAGAPAQAQVFQPTLLMNSDEPAAIRYLILNADDAEGTIARSPALKSLTDRGVCAVRARVSPPFKPLPWAAMPPFDLVLYDCM